MSPLARSPKIVNRSLEPDWQILGWFDRSFLDDYVLDATVLPDVCPAGIMRTGTVARVRSTWLNAYPFKEAIGDIGCAMSWASVDADAATLPALWNDLYRHLLVLGKTVLGSGNHFIDACLTSNGTFVILVHVGSRMTFDERARFSFARDYVACVDRALANHDEIWSRIAHVFGRVGPRTLLSHDTVEDHGDEMVIRKGVTKSGPGEPILIASSFDDAIVVGVATATVADVGDSMSHGTGRNRSRAAAKAVPVDQTALRRRIVIPDDLPDHSWRLEAPDHYRRSADVVAKLGPYIRVTDTFVPVAFMGGF